MTAAESPLTTADTLTDDQVTHFREQGFVQVRQVLTPEETAHFRQEALRVSDSEKQRSDHDVFDQHVNVWVRDEAMRRLTLHPNIASLAERLAGARLRLWHDHILIKRPHNEVATEFHQDQPYWPFSNDLPALSCWVALCDVPVERGCMTFLPGSHRRTDLVAQNLRDDRSLFTICPDMQWHQRVTIPLRAGDCTFHYGCCAHMATPNHTDEPRVAQAIIFMDESAAYNGQKHIVTDPLGLQVGADLDKPLFPRVRDIVAGQVETPAGFEGSGVRPAAEAG